MTKEELAAKLNGREIGEEMTKDEEQQAKKDWLVVVYGASDDLMEFAGYINDETGASNNSAAYFNVDGLLPDHDGDNCDCEYCGLAEAMSKAGKLMAIWDKDGYSWQYTTDIPHATFDIMEEGQKYCKGIVFDIRDYKKGAMR
jgi:hypothetical protein